MKPKLTALKCYFCNSKNIKKIKSIKKIDIFSCKNCQLGFIEKKNYYKYEPERLYNFLEYANESKKLFRRYEILAKEVLKYKSKGELLDVGAGYGLVSSIFSRSGKFKINIVEPNNSIKYLKPKKYRINKILYEKFFNTQKVQVKYDLILMFDIIEHFKNPFKNLINTKSILKKDGVLVIQTPNYLSLMAYLCSNWSWWMIEDHKYFFTTRSLKSFLSKSGYKIRFLKTYEDAVDFKKNLDGNFMSIDNIKLRKLIKLIFYLLFFPFYFIFRRIIWKLGYGGLIFIIASPNEK